LRFAFLPLEPASDFEAAARIFRRCRRAGITPRGLLDCLISAVAWRRGATLLTQAEDLKHLVEVMGIALDESSRS
jgi:predicted nucleic acid-binding protein